jgi:cysteine synthase A
MTEGLAGRVAAKLEMRNPCGSVKDRLGVALIEDAERRGILRSGMTLVEATGGNTGIGLVFAATIRGYRLFRRSPEAEPPTTIDGMMERIVTQPLRSVTSSSS